MELCGSMSDIQSALNIIEEEGPSRGLILNKEKSLLFAPSVCSLDSNTLPSEIPVCRDGFTLLGSPDLCISVVRKQLAKTQSVLDRLSDIEDSQTEYSILRSCLSLPKIVSALRTCSPTMLHSVLGEFDDLIFNYLSRLVGGFPSSWSWSKTTLPIDMGGLGLRSARHHAPSAFIGSVHLSSALVLDFCGYSFPSSYTADAFRMPSEVVGHSDWSSFDDLDFTISQRTL